MSIFDIFKKLEQEKAEKAVSPVSYLIVGLGNYGPKYDNTRHNAGFMALDALAEKYSTKVDRFRFKALTGECMIADKRVLLMKPQTYMNLSGEAVSEACAWYKIEPDHVLVLCDDITLDVGRLRVRKKGSHGGHNGLRNIIALLSADTFPRIRIGVGIPPLPDYDIIDWVLGKFNEDESKIIKESTRRAAEAVVEVLTTGTESAANKYNGK